MTIRQKDAGFLAVRPDGGLRLYPNHTQRWQFVEIAGRWFLFTDVVGGVGKATVLYRNPKLPSEKTCAFDHSMAPVDTILSSLPRCEAVPLGLSPVRSDPFEGDLVGWEVKQAWQNGGK
jgi:hypothetical protein